MAPVADDGGRLDLEALGRAFWADERVQATLDSLAGGGTPEQSAFGRVIALIAAEGHARAVAEREVAALRQSHSVTWQAIADAIGRSQSSTMQRYTKAQREANAERQRRVRARRS